MGASYHVFNLDERTDDEMKLSIIALGCITGDDDQICCAESKIKQIEQQDGTV